MKYFKKTSLILFSVCFIIAIGFIARASSDDNVSGWAWNDNTGWIGFNCTNPGDEVCAGVGDWGVDIDGDGFFSGYAWSENLGWISFNRSDAGNPPGEPFPDSGPLADLNYSTRVVRGWAKILNIDGDDGWIKLRKDDDDAGADYGVSLNPDGSFTGWAYNPIIGWISFNGLDNGDLVDYKVTADVVGQPQNVTVIQVPGSTCSALQVSWDIPVQGASGFKVLRDAVIVSDYLLNTTNVFNDSSLDSGTEYSYVVRACVDEDCLAFNDSAVVANSTNSVCQVTGLTSSGGVCPDSINLDWDSDAGADSYRVYRNDETNDPGADTTLIDSGACSSPVASNCIDTVPVGTESHRFKYQVSAYVSGPPPEEGDKSDVSDELVACPKEPLFQEIKPE